MHLNKSLLLISSILLSQPALADMKAGKALHDENCFKCHDQGVYQRGKDGRVHSYPALTQQVRRCEQTLGLTWFDDQVTDVADYLNATYYKFK